MVRYELWLGGELMDLSPDTEIDLTFRSNLFGDITTIESNYSQTIELPRTPRNARVLKTVTPASDCTIGTAIEAKLYQDGVAITDNAVAYLLNVGDTYEVCLVWGYFTNVTEWTKRKDTLQELDFQMSVPFAGTPATRAAAQAAYMYNASYSTAGPYTHPVVNVGQLFTRISNEKLGIMPTQDAFEHLKNVALPLATRTDSNKVNKAQLTSFSFSEIVAGREWHIRPGISGNADYRVTVFNGVITYSKAQNVNRIWLSLPLLTAFKTTYDGRGADLYLQVDADGETNRYWLTSASGGLYDFSYEGEIKLDKTITADSMQMSLVIVSTMNPDVRWDIEEYEFGTLVALHTEVPVGYEYDMATNMPAKLTQIDFVKGCMQMEGLALTKGTNGLQMYYYNDILGGAFGIVDWSAKFVNAGSLQQKHMTQGIAQTVWLGYKNSKAATTVPDASLDKETNLFELPFSYSTSRTVPFYEQQDDGTYKLVKNEENALLSLSESVTVATLQPSAEMSAESILRNAWGMYADWLKDPIVLECEIMLSAVDISTLVYTKLVHIEQLGRNYAILELQKGSSEIAKVKLIQIGA